MSDEDAVELYRKHRPTRPSEIVGQSAAKAALGEMIKREEIPHCILFQGPSGTGKTTLARILRMALKCSDMDFTEINAASSRGIDMVRDIERVFNLSPLGGKCRVWLIDEFHSVTGDAQNAFLKILEDTPKHAYFFLATSDPQKIKTTIKTRATVIDCKPVSVPDLVGLVKRVAVLEELALDDDVVTKISEVAEGSARKALVILHQIMRLKDHSQQMEAIEAVDTKAQAFEICRALIANKRWDDVAKILKDIKDEDPEGIRRMILAYARTVILGGKNDRAALIIEEFRENFFDCGAAGLAVGCYNLCRSK